MSSSQRPTGLITNSGIELLTFGTPNGHKVSILLEELKEAYGKEYVFQSINIMQNIQKEPWFTKHSPNGRVREEKRRDIAIGVGLLIVVFPDSSYCRP